MKATALILVRKLKQVNSSCGIAALMCISVEELKKWKNLSYVDIVKRIVSIFVANDEVPEDDQHGRFLLF